MGLIEDQKCSVTSGHINQTGEVSGIAVHGEDRVRHDHRASARSCHQVFQVLQVIVAVHSHVSPGGPAPVDDRGMVQLVGEHLRTFGRKHRQYRQIGGEPGGEHHGPFATFPLRQCGFEFGMDGSRSGYQPRRSRPRTPAIEGFVGGGHYSRMARKAEVVIRSEGHDVSIRIRPPQACPTFTVSGQATERPSGVECPRLAPLFGRFDLPAGSLDPLGPRRMRMQTRQRGAGDGRPTHR